jgi:hypothetical protein
MSDLYFVDCQWSELLSEYGCIAAESAGLTLNNCYFIRCSMDTLLTNLAGGFDISNVYQYLCSISHNTRGSVNGNVNDGGSNNPKEKMDELVATFPFPHLA